MLKNTQVQLITGRRLINERKSSIYLRFRIAYLRRARL
jgi:hypothetical protein